MYIVCHIGNAVSLQTSLTVRTLKKLLTLSFYHFRIPDLSRVRLAGIKLASSPAAADHDPCLWMAYWVMAEGVSWHLWDAPSRGIHLDDRI